MSNLGRTIRGFVFIAGQLDNNIKEEGESRWHTLFLCCVPKSRSLPPKICDIHLQVNAERYEMVKILTSMLRKGWLKQWKRFAWSTWNIRRKKVHAPRESGTWTLEFIVELCWGRGYSQIVPWLQCKITIFTTFQHNDVYIFSCLTSWIVRF